MSANRILKGKGFSLVELMITLVLLSCIVAAAMSVFIQSQKAKRNTELIAEAQQTARILLDMLADDVRSAGFGANALAGHYPIVYAAPFDLMISANLAPYPDSVVNHLPPQAIKPSVSPLPGNGLYTGGGGYTDGAETIRYSFDSNNDGSITTADRGDDLEERLTRNDSLYSLTRQVFGFSNISNNNGGTVLPVGVARSNFPVRGSGTPIYPLFSFWIYNSALGRDQLYGDANGDSTLSATEIAALTAVPTASLKDISKIGVTVTTATRNPNSKNLYQIIVVSTTTGITRNRPLKDAKTISGRVGLDQNANNILESGEPGIASIKIENRSDGQIQMTATDGTYNFNVEPKTHNIVCVVPTANCGDVSAYKAYASTETLVNVKLASAANVNFVLRTYVPGFANGITYLDANGDGVYNTGDSPLPGCAIFLKTATKLVYSASDGSYCIATMPGADSLIGSPPSIDYVNTSPARVAVTIVSGAYTTTNFGFKLGGKGIIRGKVYSDVAPIGSYGGEPGIGNVRISVYQGATPATELEIGVVGTTASDGTFRMEVPEATAANPYSIVETDSAGWVSTTPNRIFIGALAAAESTAMKYFGDTKVDTVRIPAAKVLCMTVRNFFEWQTSTATNDTASAKRDPDIVLGTKYVSTSTGNIRGWFSKRYKIFNDQETVVKNLFDAIPGIYMYEKVTGTSADIKAITSDTMNDITSRPSGSGKTITYNKYFSRSRPDLVLGLDNTGVSSPTYNVVVWPTINDDSTATENRGRAAASTNIPSSPNYKLVAVDAQNKVNSVITGNFGGDGFPDVVAGYSTYNTPNSGGFVLWQNDSVYSAGTNSGWTDGEFRKFTTSTDRQWTGLGEVKALAAGNLAGDSKTDLVVGLRTADYQGEIRIYTGTGATPWFTAPTILPNAGVQGEVNGLKIIDINNDARLDIIAIVRNGDYKGEVQAWLNNTDGTFGQLSGSTRVPTYVAKLDSAIGAGEPIAVEAAKMNWATAIYPHIVVGIKIREVSGVMKGKTLMFDCDGGVLPDYGTDPSYGKFNGEVATVSIGDFNLDGHMDIAVAERTSATEGNLIIYYPVFQ